VEDVLHQLAAQAKRRHPHQLEHAALAGLDLLLADPPALLDDCDVPALSARRRADAEPPKPELMTR